MNVGHRQEREQREDPAPIRARPGRNPASIDADDFGPRNLATLVGYRRASQWSLRSFPNETAKSGMVRRILTANTTAPILGAVLHRITRRSTIEHVCKRHVAPGAIDIKQHRGRREVQQASGYLVTVAVTSWSTVGSALGSRGRDRC